MDGAFAPWHIIVLVVVLVVLFGSRRLPGAARSIGQSMHIFKRSVSGLDYDPNNPAKNDDNSSGFSSNALTATPPAQPLQANQDQNQAQLQDLQRQVEELQRQSAGGSAGQQNQPL